MRDYGSVISKQFMTEKHRADVIAESISDGVFLLRGEEVLYLNQVAKNILGLDSEVVLQKNSLRLTDSQIFRNKDALAIILKVKSYVLPLEFACVIHGRKFYFRICSHPVFSEFLQEGTALVDEIVNQLQSSTLIFAEDITVIRENQEARSEFLAHLSHDVKTPLSSLTLAIRLLKKMIDEIPNPTHQALIVNCSNDIDRLRILIEELIKASCSEPTHKTPDI